MLTAKGEDADIVTGLELGADDYITKPFSPRVLTRPRIKAVLRRGKKAVDEQQMIITKGALVINIASHEVLVNDKQVELTPTEFDILLYMIRRPGWVFTRNQIINAVKGDDYPVTERSVDVQIVGLRKKLGPEERTCTDRAGVSATGIRNRQHRENRELFARIYRRSTTDPFWIY